MKKLLVAFLSITSIFTISSSFLLKSDNYESNLSTTEMTTTNTISYDGNSTTVEVNYVNPVPTQNIQYSIDGGNSWIEADEMEDGTNNTYDRFVITNLEANSYYDLEIKLNGNQIDSSNVNDIYTITETAISSAAIISQTSDSVYIEINVKQNLYSIIDHLNIYYSIDGGLTTNKIYDQNTSTQQIEFYIDGLIEGNFYTVEFFVENPDKNNSNQTTTIYQNVNLSFVK